MSEPQSNHPRFSNPPVTEVAVAIQFDPLEETKASTWGLLWRRFREEYPNIEEHPPRGPVFERFGAPSTDPNNNVQIKLAEQPENIRCWFLNEKGTELIQVQEDRFVFNWRKRDEDTDYPRYKNVQKKFKENFKEFADFVKKENLGRIKPNQCEVTYVNKIKTKNDVWEKHSELGNILPCFSPDFSDDFLDPPENVKLKLQFLIPNQDNPQGRLHIQANPGYDKSGEEPIIILRLTARGAPEKPKIDKSFEFFDLCHEWIVCGFASVTSKQMHEIWERKDA